MGRRPDEEVDMDREVIARRLHEARRDLLGSRTQVEGDGLDQSMAGMVGAQLAEIDGCGPSSRRGAA